METIPGTIKSLPESGDVVLSPLSMTVSMDLSWYASKYCVLIARRSPT